MRKRRFLALFALATTFCLSSCSLFNDDDIAIVNHYNPTETPEPIPPGSVVVDGGVVGKPVSTVENALCFKNIPYDVDNVIPNTYKTGGENEIIYNVNGGEDYYGDAQSNNYDLYVPNSDITPRDQDHIVMLFIHGGAWVMGYKTDVNPYVHEFANRGYITATIKYTKLHRAMDDPTLSIFRDLDEIDACIKSIKKVLGELGFDTAKTHLVIGGASSGAHLTMLYAYSRGQRSALPIEFLVNAVGPVDIKESAWRCFRNDDGREDGLYGSAFNDQPKERLIIQGEDGDPTWNDYQTMRIANGMCGMPFSLSEVKATTDENKEEILYPNAASNSMLMAGGGEDLLSATYWINQGINHFPIICAYAGKDTVVGINQYATLAAALDNQGIDHLIHSDNTGYVYFKDSEHNKITREYDQVNYDKLIEEIDYRCNNL